jgi:hypothetical protein
MGYYEDDLLEVYYEVENKGLKSEFNTQIDKMKFQDKHKYKSLKEKWEYALYRVKGGSPLEKY